MSGELIVGNIAMEKAHAKLPEYVPVG